MVRPSFSTCLPALGSLRIQSARTHRDGDVGMVPFMGGDDPYDPDVGPPVFGIYGVKDGFVEHLADRGSLEEARSLLLALLPGIWSEEVASGQGPRGREQG
jgi:hypothetical protein